MSDSTVAGESEGVTMADWFKSNMSVVWSWAALIAAAAIIFAVSRGTGFYQLGIGLLIASLALLVAMGVFELIWQFAVARIDSADDKNKPSSSPPKHRRRGQ
jgi:hypothetical protein